MIKHIKQIKHSTHISVLVVSIVLSVTLLLPETVNAKSRLSKVRNKVSNIASAVVPDVGESIQKAKLTTHSASYEDLMALPAPKGKIVAAVYNFRDQTGQYKPAPSSSFSTAVSQGAASVLTTSMIDSGWFVPLEREGLQNILNERKIIRAAQKKPGAPINNRDDLPSLLAANILLEGGIIAYDTNIRTGGAGVKYLGIGISEKYRVDQVTVNLRAVDIRTGQVLHSIMTSKTIYSKELSSGIFRFIKFKKLLELEGGFTRNEPSQLCLTDAIDSALVNLIIEGIHQKTWGLKDPNQIDHPMLSLVDDPRTEVMNAQEAMDRRESIAKAAAELTKATSAFSSAAKNLEDQLKQK